MEKDTCWKSFLSDNERYADVINGIGCNGEQIVTKEDLQELDTQTGFLRKLTQLNKGKVIGYCRQFHLFCTQVQKIGTDLRHCKRYWILQTYQKRFGK